MLEETIIEKHYVKPEFSVTVFRLKENILSSSVESYTQVVIDDGDWGDENNSAGNELV